MHSIIHNSDKRIQHPRNTVRVKPGIPAISLAVSTCMSPPDLWKTLVYVIQSVDKKKNPKADAPGSCQSLFWPIRTAAAGNNVRTLPLKAVRKRDCPFRQWHSETKLKRRAWSFVLPVSLARTSNTSVSTCEVSQTKLARPPHPHKKAIEGYMRRLMQS